MGWGPEFSPHFSIDKNLYIDLRNITPSPKKLIDIVVDAVIKVTEQFPPPYNLMISGGADSQAMLWCWHKSGIPFNVITVKYLNNDGQILNSHDIDNVNNIKEVYGIDVTYLDFYLIHFLENNMKDYAVKYQCTSPQITTYMRMSELITEGTVLFSGDFLKTMLGYTYTILGLKRYADMSKRNLVPFFLLYTPELASAMDLFYVNSVPNDVIQQFTSDKEKMFDYYKKTQAMIKMGIPIIPQFTKFSGFEKVKDLYDNRTDLVNTTDRIKYTNKPSNRFFDIIFRYKLADHIKYQDKLMMLI